MTDEKYSELWSEVILKTIQIYLKQKTEYRLALSEEKFKKDIYNSYENEFKPLFKSKHMATDDDFDGGGDMTIIGGKKIILDRHKVAALLYLSIVYNDKMPFLKLSNEKERDKNEACIMACHEIAYSISLNWG